MPLPTPAFDTAPEPFAAFWGETECDPHAVHPGVHAFRDFVLRYQGGGRGHIGRPCGATGAMSAHYSGRAWDWMISADDPAERARADELIAWLLANDAEMFRRAGLVYLIWDRQSFKSYKKPPGWYPYTRPHPHRDHVHFSFSKEGADGQTSFYQWLRAQPGMPPLNVPPTPHPYFPLERASRWPLAIGFLLGVGTIWGARSHPAVLKALSPSPSRSRSRRSRRARRRA